MSAFEMAIIFHDFFHLSFNISVGEDSLGALDEFLLIIYTIEQDRQLSLQCNEIEPAFLLTRSRSDAFGRDAEMKIGRGEGCVGQRVGQMTMFLTPNGDATDATEQRT